MSEPIKDGGPAFPVQSVKWTEDGKECVGLGTFGMTLRDYFAGQALAGMLGDPTCNGRSEHIARAAYELADAMLAIREAKS